MKQNQIHTTIFKYLTVALLLGVYISALLFDSLHAVFDHHHDAHQHCSVELETSPCHQKVYHNNDDVQGCDHSVHLIPERHHCDLCDALFAKFYTTKKEVEHINVYSTPNHIPFFKDLKITRIFYPSISLRGPPEVA